MTKEQAENPFGGPPYWGKVSTIRERLWSIEVFQLDCWVEVDRTDSLEDALLFANGWCLTLGTLNSVDAAKFDARVRIVTPDCETI